MSDPARPRQRRIAIIGAGFSGLCLGIQLRRQRIESFTVLEKSDGVGGTWRDNSYPGAACDVPSIAYCFSFEQKTDWSRKWAPQAEIQEYMEHCARKYDLLRHVRFRTEVASARFDETAALWRLRTTGGEEIEAEVLVSAVGQLNRPHTPEISGLEAFRGQRFHSARWDHAVDLRGKRVAVVGNAASAIQFVPRIAPLVERLSVFQRSANWMLPRHDREYTEREKRLLARFPVLARLYRWLIWGLLELRFPLFRGNEWLAKLSRTAAKKNLADTVADRRLRELLVPDYPIGGKRILISDDYYQALGRDNVEVVPTPIDRLTENAVVTTDGVEREVDVVIFATGFESTAFLAPMHVEGRAGHVLEADWKDGARAYRGITVAGYPNFFTMYGPNTNLGHNSILFMIECQTSYIVQAIRRLSDGDLASLEVRADAMAAYDERTQRELAGTVWAATPRSWYKTAAGRITNNWSGTTTRYWWSTRRFDAEAYREVRRARGASGEGPRETAPASTGGGPARAA